MATVSVIVPNYNHARYLRKRLDSIFAQTYQDFEVILLDDASTDGSREILESYASDPRVRLGFNEKNSGSTFKQWNKGVWMAHGKYMWIAESDDCAGPRLLETLVARLEAEPNAVLAYCRSWRMSADGILDGFQDELLPDLGSKKWAADFRADGVEECRNFLIFCNTVLSASSVVFRRAVYSSIGGADESLVYCGDWKVWAAMALSGGMICYSAEPHNFYRFHEATVTHRSEGSEVSAAEALRVSAWIMGRARADRATRRKLSRFHSQSWPWKVLNRKIPWSVRWRMFSDAMKIDYGACLNLVGPALAALRMTLVRRWKTLRGSGKGNG